MLFGLDQDDLSSAARNVFQMPGSVQITFFTIQNEGFTMKRTALLSPAFLSILAAVLFSLSLSNCKKDKNDPDPVDKICLLTHVTIDTAERSISYDAQNRIIRSESSSGAYTTYSYGNAQIVARRYDANDVFVEQSVYDLNGDGNVEHFEDTDGNTADYYYDSNGYLEEAIEDYVSGAYYDDRYLVVDGNVASIYRETGSGSILQWIYEYYTDLENKGGYFSVYDKLYYGFDFPETPRGKANRNLVKRMTLIYNGTALTPIEYEYAFTPEGYVSSMTIGTAPNDRADFVYECK